MPGRLGGQLVDGGDPVADEPVFVVDTGPADESNWSIVATDRSAADGSWSVTVPGADPERYHAVAQFEESGTLKNALSKPFLTSQPFAQPGLVTVGFDVLTPSTIYRIPDSVIHRYDARQLNLDDEDSVTTWPDLAGDEDLTAGDAPTYHSDVSEFGGLPAVSFDGANNYLEYSGDFDVPYSIFIVNIHESDGDNDRNTLMDLNGGGTFNTTSGGGFEHGARDSTLWSSSGDAIEKNIVTKGDAHLVVGTAIDGQEELRIHDPDLRSESQNESLNDVDFFALGQDDRGQRYFEGYVGEIAIALGEFDSELEQFEDHLKDKWGIE